MATILEPSDLSPFADIEPAKADAMVTHALAQALRVAPCLANATDPGVIAAAKATLVNAVLRWNDFGTASYSVVTAGPPGYPTDVSRERSNVLRPSEKEELQALCAGPGNSSQAYTLSLAGPEVV